MEVMTAEKTRRDLITELVMKKELSVDSALGHAPGLRGSFNAAAPRPALSIADLGFAARPSAAGPQR
jgi:hypothetical protein